MVAGLLGLWTFGRALAAVVEEEVTTFWAGFDFRSLELGAEDEFSVDDSFFGIGGGVGVVGRLECIWVLQEDGDGG